jgi:DNA-binding IclR family transcriptional regulator
VNRPTTPLTENPARARRALEGGLARARKANGWLPTRAVGEILEAYGLPSLGEREAADEEVAVRAAREMGYWMTEQHLDMGLRGIAMPLKDRKGECKGAIGMTLQAQAYTTESMVEKLLPLLREAAQSLRPLL